MVTHVGKPLENVEYGFRTREDVSDNENEMLKNIAEILKHGRARLLSQKLKQESCLQK